MQVLELVLLFAMIGIGAFILVNGLMTVWYDHMEKKMMILMFFVEKFCLKRKEKYMIKMTN